MNNIQATEMFSAIFRRVKANRERAEMVRNSIKDPEKAQKKAMLGGKVKAYTDVMCLIHDKYPTYLEPGLWEGSKFKRSEK